MLLSTGFAHMAVLLVLEIMACVVDAALTWPDIKARPACFRIPLQQAARLLRHRGHHDHERGPCPAPAAAARLWGRHRRHRRRAVRLDGGCGQGPGSPRGGAVLGNKAREEDLPAAVPRRDGGQAGSPARICPGRVPGGALPLAEWLPSASRRDFSEPQQQWGSWFLRLFFLQLAGTDVYNSSEEEEPPAGTGKDAGEYEFDASQDQVLRLVMTGLQDLCERPPHPLSGLPSTSADATPRSFLPRRIPAELLGRHHWLPAGNGDSSPGSGPPQGDCRRRP